MIETKQVQDRRMQIVHAGRILDGLESEIVGRAVNRAATNPTAGEPDAEPVMVVVSSKLTLAVPAQLDGGSSTELAPPNNKRVIQHASLLEVSQQGGDRLIDLRASLR